MSILALLPMLILGVGIYFLIRLRFFFILHPIKTLKKTFLSGFGKPERKAFSLALAGTLGVGNIVGVAYGISVGGAGSILWLFISGIFSSVIKYCESSLAASHAKEGRGGMMYVMARTAGRLGGALGSAYSLLCLFLSLFMGAALQAALFGFMIDSFGWTAIFITIGVLYIIMLVLTLFAKNLKMKDL